MDGTGYGCGSFLYNWCEVPASPAVSRLDKIRLFYFAHSLSKANTPLKNVPGKKIFFSSHSCYEFGLTVVYPGVE